MSIALAAFKITVERQMSVDFSTSVGKVFQFIQRHAYQFVDDELFKVEIVL